MGLFSKGGGEKGGKGFQGHWHSCGEFGDSQWDCSRGGGTDKGMHKYCASTKATVRTAATYYTVCGKGNGFHQGYGKGKDSHTALHQES